MQFKYALAPIGVSTYSRIDHLKQTIEALQKNTLAKDSELFIFSDAPQKGDEKIIAKVREYIHTVDGFKKVHIIERKKNGRVANNRGGMKQLLDKYNRCIFLEDDIVTAPGFLQFMNDTLEFYKNDDRITFVSGYVIPVINLDDTYKNDAFLLGRFESWGMGLWKRSFEYFKPIPKRLYDKVYNSKIELKALAKKNGEDVIETITLDYLGKMDGGDIKIWFWQYILNTYTIYPKNTLVKSIGQDGSGVHMEITNKWDIKTLWDQTEFKFNQKILLDQNIEKMNFNFYRRSRKSFFITFLKNIGLYYLLKIIYRKLRDNKND